MARKAAPQRLKKQQSTLTQLDFVSTPYSTPHLHEEIESDEDDWIQKEARPKRRQKRSEPIARTGRRPTNSTLTQIGFVKAEPLDVDEDHDEDDGVQVVADSQPASIAGSIPASPANATDRSAYELSKHTREAFDSSGQFKVPITPKHHRALEARSSQTPPSVILSASPSTRHSKIEAFSPTAKVRSVNFQLAPSKQSRRRVRRMDTVQDSQSYESPIDGNELGSEDERGSEDGITQTHVEGTQMVDQQCTFDPAESALDRDAARSRWTQLMQTRPLEEPDDLQDESSPQPDHMNQEQKSQIQLSISAWPAREDASSSTESSPAHRASQMSTVLPTQSSPRPPPSSIEAITPIPQKRSLRTMQSDFLPSSSLPAPPWTESERADWARAVGDGSLTKLDHDHSLADFSLPPPPQIDWTSIVSSMRAKEKKK